MGWAAARICCGYNFASAFPSHLCIRKRQRCTGRAIFIPDDKGSHRAGQNLNQSKLKYTLRQIFEQERLRGLWTQAGSDAHMSGHWGALSHYAIPAETPLHYK